MPVRCCAASGPGGRARAAAMRTSTARSCAPTPSCSCKRAVADGGRVVAFAGSDWDGQMLDPARTFVTGVGAGTTYPDYKPAPFIVSAEHDGLDTVTVVTEGIFSYCGVKVKIDTDRHLGPETAPIRVEGEQVGHVTTAEYGSQMLSIGGVRHLTGGSKKEGNVTCDALLQLCAGEPVAMTVDGGHSVVVQAGAAPIVDGRPEERMRVGCGSATVGIFARQWAGAGRRGDRRRRPHHRRADRASGRPLPRHALPPASACAGGNRRRGATSRSRSRASAGAAPTSPTRSRSSRRSIPTWPGPACACSSPRPPAKMRSTASSTRICARCRRRCPARCAPWSIASARTASRRSARCCSWPAPAGRSGPASPRTRCCSPARSPRARRA